MSGKPIRQSQRRKQQKDQTANVNDETNDNVEQDGDAEEVNQSEEPTLSNSEVQKLLLEIKKDTTRLLEENVAMKENIKGLEASLKSTNEQVRCLDDESKAHGTKLKELEERLRSCELEKDELEQYTRKFNLEIAGIPKHADTSDLQSVLTVANAIKVDIEEKDIDIIHRLKTNNKDGNQSTINPIIVRFKSYEAKRNLYRARKNLKDVDWESVFGEPMKVYINENLTKRKGKMFKAARLLVKQKQAWRTWTIDGKVFLLKTQTSPPQLIRTIEDLEKVG